MPGYHIKYKVNPCHQSESTRTKIERHFDHLGPGMGGPP
eukprot:CAMPEP_0202403154 /NCGR_PEP_ID=MMETSP1128-20130828/4752_1 /ASSEMBLY_ACC=CAM_ASM_000463 /TAXON_ID=3047 /ORGANISM="Dunaliella tertiolecta, Strain CCMP1320" /LENGTH=38 /DNA_ID= /DNA_START= /DNA_END= /DNA_ORIENTATION=